MAVDLTILKNELPPIFAREEVDRLFGGLVSRGYLANLDCIGEGPPRLKMGGRKVGYLREPFLEWLGRRMERQNR